MTAPHDKLHGIKPGDRVRVTFEGGVNAVSTEQIDIIPDLGALQHIKTFRADVIWANGFQIERIEPPLKVGDRVRPKAPFGSGQVWEIVAIKDGYAVLYGGKEARVICPTNLERIA